MLSEKRIKEANANVATYLADSLLQKTTPDKQALAILLQNANESLDEARRVESTLWKIVISYYSMFYIANAVLTCQGYKVGEKVAHKITADALIALIRPKLTDTILEDYENAQEEALSGIKADEIVSSFDYERRKRGTLQYSTTETAKRSKAETSLKRAQEFMFVMRKLL